MGPKWMLCLGLVGCGRLEFIDHAARASDGGSGSDSDTTQDTSAIDAPAPPNSATYQAGTTPSAIVAAEFTGDAFADLAVANRGDNSVTILVNDGTGKFTAGTTIDLGAGNGPVALYAHDFDGDSNMDLAIANATSGSVVTFLGHGDGTFTRHATVTIGGQPQGFAPGDFNRDGKFDLAVPMYLDHEVSIMFGDGLGGFPTSQISQTGSDPIAIIGAALNSTVDSHDDLAIACKGVDSLEVLLGDGSGMFPTTHMVTGGTGAAPTGIAVADFNGDTKPDLAIADSGTGTVAVSTGDGAGNYAAVATFNVGTSPYAIAAGDVNGDPHPDLVVTDFVGGSAIDVLHGDGAGGFAAMMAYQVGSQPDAVILYDLNNDGVNDVVVANSGSSNVTVILGPL